MRRFFLTTAFACAVSMPLAAPRLARAQDDTSNPAAAAAAKKAAFDTVTYQTFNSWTGTTSTFTVSKDGMTYEFVIRKNAKFHNGDPVTADDVKFTFDRYKGASAGLLKSKVKDVQVVAPNRVRFVLKEAWPDFMAFYGTWATGAGWIVPKKYIEKVGEDGFKKAPIGAGPFKFVSFNPGVELVLDAFPDY